MTDLVERAREALDGVTPGPWGWEVNLACKTVELCGDRGDLTVMDFVRWGMQHAAPRFWRWSGRPRVGDPKRADEIATPAPGREHHRDWYQVIDDPNARFIAEARTLVPDMADRIEALEAENARLRKRVEAADRLADKINTLQISGNRVAFPALDEALDAYRATKEQK